jgi:hypothetical protein
VKLILRLILVMLVIPAARADTASPRVFTWDANRLALAKGRIGGDLKPALEQLRGEADKALQFTPVSVMDKKLVADSGDKHDYMSIAPYFWPDPGKADGLPYIRRDGEVNPERHNRNTDAAAFAATVGHAQTLALAYYFTEKPEYAAHAAKLLRAWFLDPATRMNPNLNFAQAIPGKTAGRGTGIIDTVSLIGLVDSIGLLHGSASWSDDDRKGMVAWFDAYLNWLLTSKNGKDEAAAANNHGTWYDAQVACYALFVGKDDLAKRTIETAKARRIDPQIKPDGSMPLELARTNSLSYSAYNLTAFFNLARLGERVNVDLWGYKSKDGGGLRKALDFVAPYVDRDKPWPHPQISAEKRRNNELPTLLRRAALAYKAREYEELLQKHAGESLITRRMQLLYAF